jgi:hypothetical protein
MADSTPRTANDIANWDRQAAVGRSGIGRPRVFGLKGQEILFFSCLKVKRVKRNRGFVVLPFPSRSRLSNPPFGSITLIAIVRGRKRTVGRNCVVFTAVMHPTDGHVGHKVYGMRCVDLVVDV